MEVRVPPAALEALSKLLTAPALVELVPRRLVQQLWLRDFGNSPFPGLYAFRAFTRDDHIRMLSDWTETPQSLTWLLIHELAHFAVNQEPLLDRALRSIPKPAKYLTDDHAHGEWLEEKLANAVADQLAPSVGSSAGLNRLWWRRRVNRLRRRSRPGL